ncbi:hypothetical protein EVAR_62440_1 [Eumeta japonica]|uniref:Uncharacterized protein n=1 Tax=Eumeta variegata TaxID=151549 RepID=A0A4C1Z492_EUMVA|nr:hypothetical protein EVAR_62440_1 [Eumeta japonica]
MTLLQLYAAIINLNEIRLVQLVAANRATYFHQRSCSHCQRFPKLQSWLAKPPTKDLEAGNALVTTLRLRVSMGSSDQLSSGDLHVRLPLKMLYEILETIEIGGHLYNFSL